jgi:hypothetical protein
MAETSDPLEAAAAELEAAESASDEQRARVLEELHETLESELERDGAQAGSPRR